MCVPSPCTGLCMLSPSRRLCLGCGRSLEEIQAWPELTDAERRSILSRIEARIVPPKA
jgi:predicted Fe-S protein YdhL (DUF1289 family)